MATPVFINEFHYDNAGTDAGEFVEIAGPAGTDLTGWSVVRYNGNGGAAYSSPAATPSGADTLAGALADAGDGFGFAVINYLTDGLQNGAPDGLALVNNSGTVVQFLSYEGSFTAVGGPANGQASTDIGASETGSTVAGTSLQLAGTGIAYEDFAWTAGVAATAGATNSGQSFDAPPPPPPLTEISDIQGAAHLSPLLAQRLTTSGIVTAVDSNGFYLQDVTGDGNDATSDAIFVFTSSVPRVQIGDALTVEGTVTEFTPGGTSSGNLSITELTSPAITVQSQGNPLPAPVTLGAAGRLPPGTVIDNDGLAIFDPNQDGIDFYESLEAMRVLVNDARAVSPTNGFGEVFTVVDNGIGATGLSSRGTINIAPNDFNPERVQIDDDSFSPQPTPVVGVGAALGDVVGVVSYAFGNYEVLASEPITVTPSTLTAETAAFASGPSRLTVAAYNVENLDPGDDRFDEIAAQIVGNLMSPDIVALVEIQDNNGATNDAVTAADVTLRLLVDEIADASGIAYDFVDHPFIGDDTNGGEPGGNIRVAYIFNPERVDLIPGSVRPVTDPATQTDAIIGNNPFDGSRPPLAADFRFNGEEITLIANHFSSKGGSKPLFGTTQPSVGNESSGGGQEDPAINGSLDDRRAQADEVKVFVDAAGTNVVVLGDLNEFEFISPVETLEDSLVNLTETLPEDERYSYVFEGNSQSLDHILATASLAAVASLDVVHINAEFTEESGRISDHDPTLAGFALAFPGRIITDGDAGRTLVGTVRNDLINASGGNDNVFGLTGADALYGGDGNDSAHGGFGDDRLIGGPGDDLLDGDIGDDIVRGGAGNDILRGSLGADLLDGGVGNDEVIPGLGADLIVLRPGSGTDTVVAFADGTDTFLLANSLQFGDLSIVTGAADTRISTAGGEVLAIVQGRSLTLDAEDFQTYVDADLLLV